MAKRWLLALLLSLLFFGGAAEQARAQNADAEFRDGVNAFEEGRFEDAEQHFRNVIKSKPGYEQALRYRDEAGYHFWVRVLARQGRLATVAERILKLAEEAAVRERQDQQTLRRELQGLWSNDFREEFETKERLIAKYGHYVVPEVVDVLSDRREDEKIVRVLALLARLGDEATLAVAELLESDEATLQQNAAIALGYTHDVRAVPPLKKLAQSAEDPHVRDAAESAIAQIEGPDYSTAEYYTRIAEEFYRENALLLGNRYSEHVVWEWRNGRLTPRVVPGWRWNEELAEEFVYEGLSVEPDNQALWTLLLNVYAQEYVEIDESLRVAQQIQDRGGDVDRDELGQMRNLQRQLDKVKMLVASRGPEALFSALGKALEDQRAPVAVFLIERLQELDFDTALLGSGGTVTYLPPAETGGGQPAAQPSPAPATQPSPSPSPSPVEQPQPSPVEQPQPSPVEDDDPWAEDDPFEDDAPPPPEDDPWAEDDPFEDDAPPPPEDDDEPERPSRTRRVSQADPQPPVRNRVERFGYREPQGNNAGALGALGTTGDHPTGGEAFAAALGYGDKRVRYAAAIAAAHLNPPEAFSNSGQVMVNLIDALGESSQRVVLVVERDQHNRNRIVGLLRELGYMAFGVETGRTGLVRAKSFPGEDLIIVSSELNPGGSGGEPIEIQFIDELREDYRTAPIKTMVLTPYDRVDEMQTLVDEGRALDVITPEIDRATLADTLDRAFSSPEDERDEKARSDAIAERAALAIAQLEPGHTVFDIAQAGPALAQNVKRASGRPDRVRLACLQGISAVGPAARSVALDVLVTEFRDPINAVEVREALATAIGDVVQGQSLPGDTFQVLKAALGEDDERIWGAAGYALGKANLTGQQALEVFQEQRLE